MNRRARGRPSRTAALVTATVLCYAVGYPLALWAHYAVGWVLVTLGGVLLLMIGVVVIRRVQLGSEDGLRARAGDLSDVMPPPASGTSQEEGPRNHTP